MKNKTVLITGASRGIGKAAATAFAQKKYNIVVNYHTNRDAALAVAERLDSMGCNALPIQADVSDQDQVNAMFMEAAGRFGGVDILVNNAGIATQQLLCDTSAADWDRIFSINIRGMFLCAKAALPYMIAQKSGSIINLSSIWGIAGASCEVAYSASKAAVIGFTKALAKEAGPSGIRVNCVAPGVIDTDMNAALDAETTAALGEETPLGRLGSPDEIASVIRFLASDEASFITGQVISPNGGFII